jgi:hypothetical protein
VEVLLFTLPKVADGPLVCVQVPVAGAVGAFAANVTVVWLHTVWVLPAFDVGTALFSIVTVEVDAVHGALLTVQVNT